MSLIIHEPVVKLGIENQECLNKIGLNALDKNHRLNLNEEEFQTYIAMGESRNQEFKETMNWNDDNTKFRITKAILAMSNTRNGGNIFIGIKETEDKRFLDEGMTKSDYDSFNTDFIKDYISRYTDPPARIDIQKVRFSEKNFIIIKVPEFEEYPIICKKAYDLGGKIMLENGAVCIRTVAGKPQSSKVITHVDMREIINLSTEKRIKEISKLVDIAISPSQEEVDQNKFEEQISGF